jgi:glycosyltransferase involved in cell wall biosynthesis
MPVEKFPGDAAPEAELAGNIAVLPSRRERLAIVSTRNKLCGIAAYTQALERQLADIFDIRVFDLDQYLLRSQHPRVRPLGDRHIEEICREIADFDAVNLQLEHGTLGRSAIDIFRRFARLVDAAPRLSVTFHTLRRPPTFPVADFAKAIVTLNWRTAAQIEIGFARDRKLSLGIAQCLRRAQRHKPVGVIVHNRRDLSDARHLHGFERVFDHPLTFLSSAESAAIYDRATRRNFTQLDPLAADTVLVGVFGFINDYKGFGTAVRALHHLPKNHHLLIFGGIHPNEIPAHRPIHPALASLLDDAYVDATPFDQLRGNTGLGLNLDIERHIGQLFGGHPRDLSDRMHFMGALDDAEFFAGMAVCDAVVFPYLEVGQSASGPISQAVELGCRVLASRTHAFLEFAAYHPDTVEFFDIGNHLELAERIAVRRQYAARRERQRYDVETNKAIYLAANTAPAEAAPRFRQHRGGVPRERISVAR